DKPYLQLDVRATYVRRPGYHPHRTASDRRTGHRPNLPEHRVVRQRDASAKPADRPALPFACRHSVANGVPAIQSLVRTPPPREGGGRDRISRSPALPGHVDRQPSVRRAKGGRTWQGTLHGTEAAAAR